MQPEYRERLKRVSMYCFSEALSAELTSEDVVASGSSGSAIELFLLGFEVKENQRVLHTPRPRGNGVWGAGQHWRGAWARAVAGRSASMATVASR